MSSATHRRPHRQSRHNEGVSEPSAVTITNSVDAAVVGLLAGALVAFATETVYGLGALATDESAVARVFKVKGRPTGHPLIVHLPDRGQLDRWSRGYPAWALALAESLWPGPLTLVVPRSSLASDALTGGQATVGLRVPSHPMALDLLRAVGTAVAAPSANRFGGVSPTTAQHVVDDLGPYLDPTRDLVLDGGPCDVGVESTIVLAIDDVPRLLRPGAISEQAIADITGRAVGVADSSVRAPGTLPSHYSPHATVIPCTADELARVTGFTPETAGLIAEAHIATPPTLRRLASPVGVDNYARELYAALRAADRAGLSHVVAVPPEGNHGLSAAIRDRLIRAAHSS